MEQIINNLISAVRLTVFYLFINSGRDDDVVFDCFPARLRDFFHCNAEMGIVSWSLSLILFIALCVSFYKSNINHKKTIGVVISGLIILIVMDAIFFYWETGRNVIWVLILLGFSISLGILLIITYKKKNTLTFAVTVLFSGYILYYIGFSYEGTPRSLSAMLLRPLMSAIEMFASHSDLLEVNDICKKNPVYMTFFTITHLLAIGISIYVILYWIYQRLYQKARIWRKYHFLYDTKLGRMLVHVYNKTSRFFGGKSMDSGKMLDCLYVFFDTNDSAWTLAKNITEHHNEVNNKEIFQIFFIDEPKEKEDEKEEKRFVDLLRIKNFRKGTQDRINSKEVQDALFMRSDKNISSHFSGHELADIWECMGLKKILTIIQKTNKNIHLFLFSEDADDNLRAVQNIIEWGKKNTEITQTIEVYCKARYNEKNRIYEELGYLKKTSIHIHIVDDASLSILSVKKERDYQPIQYVEIEPRTALVRSTFEALILGFGQTGRDAFRFLYEYATFAGIQPQHNGDERSPIKIHVYDKNMRILKGGFFAKSPALMEEHNKSRYAFHSLDVNTLAFWEQMKLLINQINYVVIALGDDDTNITAAIDLYKFAIRYRTDLTKKFDVFVRLYTMEKEIEFMKIKKHLCKKVIWKNPDRQDIINNQDLISFGGIEKIYTYNEIVKEDTLTKAQLFALLYKGEYNKELGYDENCKNAKDLWEQDSKGKDTLIEVWNQIRQNEQDISNSLHIQTKVWLMQKARLMSEDSNQFSFLWPDTAIIEQGDDSKEENNVDENDLIKYLYLSNVVGLHFYGNSNQGNGNQKQFDNTEQQAKYDKECREKLKTLSTLIQQVEERSKGKKSPISESPTEKEKPIISTEQIRELGNIAKCEHLRWNALSELQGYLTMDITREDKNEKDLVSKKLSCLCPWETLKRHKIQDGTRVYDYNIVLGSILLYYLMPPKNG